MSELLDITKYNKPVVLFTNFWDAEMLIGVGPLHLNIEGRSFKIDSSDNFSVHSIALGHPLLSKIPNIKLSCDGNLDKLDIFCPTYDLLQRYKKYGDWQSYVKDYMVILGKRKADVALWVRSLKAGHLYMLCCWENTSGKSHCHRDILYNNFIKSKFAMQNVYPMYRSGGLVKNNNFNKLDNYLTVESEKDLAK